MDNVCVNGKCYEIIRLLGKGKGGYSYLAKADDKLVVIKQIHHEPCDYYQFGNKIEAEASDYEKLKRIGIRMPLMIAIDRTQEIIVKEFIDGPTIMELVNDKKDVSIYIEQARLMAKIAKDNGLNIDYYPTNFVVQNNLLYYIDYECNNYMDEWSFENWGVNYWKTN